MMPARLSPPSTAPYSPCLLPHCLLRSIASLQQCFFLNDHLWLLTIRSCTGRFDFPESDGRTCTRLWPFSNSLIKEAALLMGQKWTIHGSIHLACRRTITAEIDQSKHGFEITQIWELFYMIGDVDITLFIQYNFYTVKINPIAWDVSFGL